MAFCRAAQTWAKAFASPYPRHHGSPCDLLQRNPALQVQSRQRRVQARLSDLADNIGTREAGALGGSGRTGHWEVWDVGLWRLGIWGESRLEGHPAASVGNNRVGHWETCNADNETWEAALGNTRGSTRARQSHHSIGNNSMGTTQFQLPLDSEGKVAV